MRALLAAPAMPLGNGQTTDFGYDSRLRVSSIVTGAKQNLALTYDESSNVKTVTDALASETVTYSYDDLNRLTAATGFAGGGSALYEYNAIGNLTRKKEGTLDLTLNYPASGQGAVRPHAATSATFTGLGGTYKTLLYDANGNLDTANGAESDYTFDAENRLKIRTHGGATTTYVYDGNGTMVKRTTSGPSGSEAALFIGGIYEKNLTTGAVTKYYSSVAMRKGGVLSYLLRDHLGGTTTVLDAGGNVTASRKYWPYGAERSVSGDQRATDRWYTGQRDEDFDGLGLYNYNARFYSTTLGRFASADVVIPEASSRGSNRYAYAGLNPQRFIDRDGFCFTVFQPVPLRNVTVDCNGVDDLLKWVDCVISCNNWVGDLARWAMSVPYSGWWENLVRHGDLFTPANILIKIAVEARSNTLALVRVPSLMWSRLGDFAGVSGAFLLQSTRALVHDNPLLQGNVSDDDFVGATLWWHSFHLFPGYHGSSLITDFLGNFAGYDEASFWDAIERKTINVALTRGEAWVDTRFARLGRAWSDFQKATIVSPAVGYDAPPGGHLSDPESLNPRSRGF